MSAGEVRTGRKEELMSRLLPKNYRQIGEPGEKKIYMEDYVYTYLRKMAQPGNLYARGAILFGKCYQTASGPCLFISGAAACQNIEFDLEETVFSEEVWEEIYQVRDTFFPELTICGWFLSRMGFSVDLTDKIIRMHMDNFSGDNKVLYMMDVLEDEDAFYRLENYALKKQKGYYIYYEANHEMAEYMQAEGNADVSRETARVSSELFRDSSVVNNYKKTLQKKKTNKKAKGFQWTPSAVAGLAVMVMALVYGAYSVHQFRQEESLRDVFGRQEAFSSIEDTREEDTRETFDELDGTGSAGKADADGSRDTAAEPYADDIQDDAGSFDRAESQDDSESRDRAVVQDDSENQDGSENQDLGDEVKEANQEKDQDSEEVFTQEDPDEVLESWSYIGGQYTVKQGDTLASISKDIYQSYDYIQKIADENDIENINKIYPGQVLKIPQIDD